MPNTETIVDTDAIRDEWLDRLNQLVGEIEGWAKSLDWSTRRVDKPLKDSTIGRYKAPGLLMQKEFTRILVDPISRSTSGSEGLVDVYLMPALDDIASLYFYDGQWNLHYRVPNNQAATTIREEKAKPLTRETLAEVLDIMVEHGA